MAVSLTALTSNASGTDSTSYTTASVSPSANGVLCVAVLVQRNSGIPSTPSISGLSLSWTTEQNNDYHDGTSAFMGRLLLAYAPTGASPGSGTISISLGGTTHTACVWAVFELTGTVDTSDPFVQSVSAKGTGGTSGSATLSSFADATNGVALGITSHQRNEGHTPGSGFTELQDVSGVSGGLGSLQVEYKTGEDTSVDASWPTSVQWGMIAAEVRVVSVVTVTGDSGAATASGGTATPVVTVTADSGVATAAGGDATVIGDKTVTGDSGSASADGSAATPVVAVSGDAGSASADGTAATPVVSVAATAGAATAAGTTAVPTITVTGDSGVATAGGTSVTVRKPLLFGLTPTVLTLTGASADTKTLTGVSASALTLTPISPGAVSVSPVTADTLTATPAEPG